MDKQIFELIKSAMIANQQCDYTKFKEHCELLEILSSDVRLLQQLNRFNEQHMCNDGVCMHIIT